MPLGQVFLRINLFSSGSIIQPTLHTHLHLHIVLTSRTNGRSLGTPGMEEHWAKNGFLQMSEGGLSISLNYLKSFIQCAERCALVVGTPAPYIQTTAVQISNLCRPTRSFCQSFSPSRSYYKQANHVTADSLYTLSNLRFIRLFYISHLHGHYFIRQLSPVISRRLV